MKKQPFPALAIGWRFITVAILVLLATFAFQAFAQTEDVAMNTQNEVTESEVVPADFLIPEESVITPPTITLLEGESSTTPEVIEEVVEDTTPPTEEVTNPATALLAETPELSTDKEEYAPEETATIFGKFFGSVKNIVLRFVAGSLLEPEEVYFENSVTVTTDEEGAFTFDYQLSHIFAPLYRIFAEDEEGNILAEDSFIDPLQTSFTQCANDDPLGCDWIGSIIQQSNSVYYEGMTVPQRLLFRDAAIVNGNHTISFTYQYTKAGIHAYDFLATVNPKLGLAQGNGSFTPGTPVLDPCGELNGQDLSTCNALNPASATPVQISIPNDSFDSKDAGPTGQTDKENAFEALTASDRYISAYSRGGTVSFGTPTLVHNPVGANSDTGDSEVTITIPFTSNGCAIGDSCDILLYFGGHLAVTGDGTGETWGPGLGSSQISGGPYHIKTVKFDGTGGSQDNQIKGADILLPPAPGKIIIVKQTIPDGNNTQFTFNPSWSAQDFILSDGQQNDSGDLDAGVYSVSETVPNGWTQTSAICSDGSPIGAIDVAEGETVTCTFTNTLQQGTLTLVKTVTNDNAGTAATTDWTLSASGPTPISGTTGSGSVTNAAVNAGVYTLSESTGPAGYTAGTWSCVGATANASQVTVPAGQNVTCTINNNDNAPSLTLIKEVVNDNGGSALATAWTLTADGPTDISGAGGAVSDSTFDAGTYALSESTGPAGYTAGAWNCVGGTQNGSQITVGLGQSATCTIINNDNQAYITVTKVVTNDNGGSAAPNDFALKLEGNAVSSGVQVPVNPGTYTAAETLLSGYTFEGFSGDCDVNGDVTVALGESKTCTLTNNDQQSYIVVNKTVENNDGGTALPNEFLLKVDGNAVSDEVAYAVNPGAHKASETLLTGYTAGDWGTDCDADGDVTVALGQTKTCTITNTDDTPTLKLVKTVVNDNGGNAAADDWTLTAVAANPKDTRNISTLGGSDDFSPVFADVVYTLDETGPAGYSEGAWSCNAGSLEGSTLTVELGQAVTCTIVNNDIAPSITLVKDVVNNNGGTAGANDFGLTIGGTPATSGQSYDVLANTPIALNEAGLTGYSFVDITGDAKCPAVLNGTVTLNEDEHIICTIKNDDIAPSLTLVKQVTNDDGGDAVTTDWTLTADGPTDISGTGGAVSGTGFSAGSYALSESTGPAGYTAGAWNCVGGTQNGSSVSLALGQSATCTIINNDQPGKLKVTKITDPASDVTTQFDITASADGDGEVQGVALQTIVGGQTVEYTVDQGTYDVSEADEAGWVETANTCNDVVVPNGGEGSCTITNVKLATITIVKNAVPNDSQDFNFNNDFGGVHPSTFLLDDDNTVALPNSRSFAVMPGTYSVTEDATTGWEFDGATCADQSLNTAINVSAGEEVTCTFENQKLGTIVLIKNTLGGDGTFDFDLSGDSIPDTASLTTVAGTDTETFNNVDPDNTYSITETVPAGWEQVSVACIQSNGTPKNPASFEIASGQTVTCTFTNGKLPTLTLTKNVINNNGGTATEADFQGMIDAGNVSWGSPATLAIGAHTATETTLPTYAPSAWGGDCATDGSITLAYGENKTCSITNDDIPAHLIVIKHVINDNGGTKLAGNFTTTISGVTTANPTVPGVEHPGVDNILTTIGAYSADEGAHDGYAKSLSEGCTGTIGLGETKTCVITNDDIAPKLTLIKEVTNNNGGTAEPEDWTLTAALYNANNPQTGTYDLSESGGPDGYTQTSLTCSNSQGQVTSVTLGLAEEVTCTFVNDDVAPKLHLRKVVVNDNGGTATVANFTLSADSAGSNDVTGTSPVDSGIDLQIGTFALSETNLAGYTASDWVCDGGTQNGASVTLALGEEATCTITNDDQPGKIKIVKNTLGGNDTFNFTVTGPTGSTPSVATTNGTGSTDDLVVNAGSYAVSETVPAGWDLTNSSCTSGTPGSFSVPNGGTVTCTFENTKRGHLIVEKTTLPAGDATSFAILAAGTGTITDGGAGTITDATDEDYEVTPGTYSVTETVPAGWKENSNNCDDVVVPAGETKTCAIVNEKLANLTIIKDAQPNDVSDFVFSGGTLGAFTLDDDAGVVDPPVGEALNEWSNSKVFTNISASAYTVSETQPNQYWKMKQVTCVDGGGAAYTNLTVGTNSATITLTPGVSVTCTYINEKISPTRTQGFWQTHTTYTSARFTALFGAGMVIGSPTAKTILTHAQLFGAYYSSIPKKSNGTQRTAIDKARMQLLQQLVTAKLNCAAFGCTSSVQTMITQADLAYSGTSAAAILASAGALDAYNNSGDTIVIGNAGKATPKTSQTLALLTFWDIPKP